MEGPDAGHVVVNTVCRRESAGEVCDEQAHGGDIWINKAEMVMISELYESLCLFGVVSGCAWVEGVSSQV